MAMPSAGEGTETIHLSPESARVLRIVLPIVYVIIALVGLVGNLVVLQIICANRFRHKSIHLLALSIALADLFFLLIFTIVRSVSYGFADTAWIINRGEWCKAEMYILRTLEFVLAYSVVFLCLDRAVKVGSCWFGMRRLRSGLSIFISIWIASAYVLIPILLFRQDLAYQSYGGYLCFSTDESVPLFWLGNFPRRTLDFIDIVFRTLFPAFLMIVLIIAASFNLSTPKKDKYFYNSSKDRYNPSGNSNIDITRVISNDSTTNFSKSNSNYIINTTIDDAPGFITNLSSTNRNFDTRNLPEDINNHTKRLYGIALSYSLLFLFCQLPYEIYRCVMLWNSDIEADISFQKRNVDFAIEIPLLFLKLLNRCVNPYFFICLGDVNSFKRGICRLWCLPCLPGCIGCKKCWCYDCYKTSCFELKHCCCNNEHVESPQEDWSPTGLLTVSKYQYREGDRLVTKQKIVEEYETGIEPYYKNPNVLREIDFSGVLNKNFDIDNEREINLTNNSYIENNKLASFRLNQSMQTSNFPQAFEEQKRIKL